MAEDFIGKMSALRDEAWGAVMASPAYVAFKALDDALNALGTAGRADRGAGAVVFPAIFPRSITSPPRAFAGGGPARISQADAASAILDERGEPTTGTDLLSALPQKGAAVGGANPVVNFTSAMSKAGRFKSIRRDGSYFWWFKDRPLPPGWNETGTDDFDRLLAPASSVSSSQEGGESDAATTT